MELLSPVKAYYHHSFRYLFVLIVLCKGVWVSAGYAVESFDLSRSALTCSDFSRGAAKDAIPSMDRPKFLNVNQVDYLKPGEPVIGVSIGGESRAYPLRLLLGHEVVNDQLGDQFIAVTYCPICGTAMVFDRVVGGAILEFGVSGLLHKGDLVLYDRSTESLWSQIGMEALSGPYTGSSLTLIPASYSTWAAWRKEQPQGQVLSLETGYDRDYRRVPFLGAAPYGENGFVHRARRADDPEDFFVLGLVEKGYQKAYSLADLAKTDGVTDTVNGRLLRLEYDADRRKPLAKDLSTGRPVGFILARWFAWKAFYPESSLYEKK
ncbi:MAG: DUF3179 domain-containing protein [Opitutales bacterium]